MNKLSQFTWELPQTLVALFIRLFFKNSYYTTYKDAKVFSWNRQGGISLGEYIFIPIDDKSKEQTPYVQDYIKHEYGHTLQSKRLGLIYLLVIGIPSFIWAACFDNYRLKNNISYYSFYTESWADKLGGVNR